MTSRLPAPPGGCQAGHRCSETACFRGQAIAASGSSPARKDLLGCAKHLGALVLELTAWVHDEKLQGAELSVRAIDSVAHPAAAGTEAEGFPFITYRITSDSATP